MVSTGKLTRIIISQFGYPIRRAASVRVDAIQSRYSNQFGLPAVASTLRIGLLSAITKWPATKYAVKIIPVTSLSIILTITSMIIRSVRSSIIYIQLKAK